MKAQVPETQQQPKDQRRVIFQERQRKLLNQEAGLRSKSFNNRKSFGLEQLLGAFWVQRNSEKRAGSWDCVARHYISFFLSFLTEPLADFQTNMPFHDIVLLYLVFIMSSAGNFYHLKHFLVNPTAVRTLPGYLIIFLISCAFL